MKEITSAKNALIQDMRSLRRTRDRAAAGRMLVEGEVMIREALSSGLVPYDLLTEESRSAGAWEAAGFTVYLVPKALLESVCDTRTPQGVCATFSLPGTVALQELPERVVALDGVQDPGNCGTIWRTADAAGFQAVIFGAGSADPLSPKVLRSAMGSAFRIPFMQTPDLRDALLSLRSRGWEICVSELHGTSFYEASFSKRTVLVVGSEAHGVDPRILENADQRLTLPMRGRAESLNAAVAAGIMLYEIARNLDPGAGGA